MISSALYSLLIRILFPTYYNARTNEKDEYKRLVMVSLLCIIIIILGNVSIKYCSLTLDQVRKPSLLNYRLSVVQCLLGPQSLNTYCTTKSSPGTSMLP